MSKLSCTMHIHKTVYLRLSEPAANKTMSCQAEHVQPEHEDRFSHTAGPLYFQVYSLNVSLSKFHSKSFLPKSFLSRSVSQGFSPSASQSFSASTSQSLFKPQSVFQPISFTKFQNNQPGKLRKQNALNEFCACVCCM